ncbi:hypothetical protein ACHAWU_003843 [Discostella pseudostelligera]|uniref:Uncharacterized protein n=1 Tax=Discostella pseudostelligera TaxID=259834 RepID=A0ABD3MHI2_9STRA
MVGFSNLRTPPKLRTPTKLSVSFITRRSTPRPTPRSTRGGRVQSLIDKFNGMNQHSDSSVKSTDNINEEGGEYSTGDITMMPAKDKSFRGFKRMKSTSRPDAFLSLDDDKIISARSGDDDLERAASEISPSMPKPPSVSTSRDTAIVTNREMGVETTRDLSIAGDSAFIPQAPTTSSDEPFDVKNLPFECDDEDKENDCFAEETRAIDQTSHIRKSWLSAKQSSSSSSSAATKVGKSPHQSMQIDDSWLSSSSSSSATPIDEKSDAMINCTTNVLQAKRSSRHEQQASTEILSTKSMRNRNLRRLFSDNSKEWNRVNVEKSEKVNEKNENISRAIGNNRSVKFRNSKINAIKTASKRLTPNRSKPPLYNMMQVEPDVPIAQQSFSPTGCCVGVNCGKHYGFGRSESDDVDSRMIDEKDGQSTDSLTSVNDKHDIVVNETNDLDHAEKDNVVENEECTIAQASTDLSDEDPIPMMEVVQKNNSGQLLALSRSESPFHQQARSAMTAAGIESVSQSRSKSTDGDNISLNKTNEIGGGIEEMAPRRLNTNNEIDTDIDGDVLVMVGSELETIEITKTSSSVKHQQQQNKSSRVRKSQFHDVARVAMAAAVVAEQTKHNSRDLGVCSSNDAASFDNDVPVVDGIVEVTTVTSSDDTAMHVGNGNAEEVVEEEIFLEEIGMNSNHLPPTSTAAAVGAAAVGAAAVGTAARNGDDEEAVEEEVFPEEIGMNDNSPPPTAAGAANAAAAAAAEERTIIVSASSSSTSSRLHPPPAPAPSTLPSQPPKFDYAQLLMPYLVNYGYPPPLPAATATMPCYQYPYPAQYGMPPPAPPLYPMQSVYYPPPPPHPPTATTTTAADGTIYIHL